ncbi:hypothetical protein [Bradyrhizobium sp. 5.13L]
MTKKNRLFQKTAPVSLYFVSVQNGSALGRLTHAKQGDALSTYPLAKVNGTTIYQPIEHDSHATEPCFSLRHFLGEAPQRRSSRH